MNSIAGEATRVETTFDHSELEFSWPATKRNEEGELVRPYFELEQSGDLVQWQPLGERLRAAGEMAGETLRMKIKPESPRSFYRLRLIEPRLSTLGEGGAEVFGYAEALKNELERIGQISVEEFETSFGLNERYLPQIRWDPTTAQYWAEFNADPAVVNKDKAPGTPGYRTADFRLNSAELEVLRKNGFVVSERLGSGSFANVFYNLWHNDLPVFVSTDAILQAWHRTYDSMLEEIEETYLFEAVGKILAEMALKLPEVWAEADDGVLKESIRDADYFLAVARALLADNMVGSMLGQDSRVAETLTDIQSLSLEQKELFGECRMVDFSQFQVRGHYTHTYRLQRYFRCVMWLGRTDFAVAGGPFERCPGQSKPASPRETGAAIVLWDLLHRSGQFNSWLNVDRIVEAFVGWSDSLNFAHLGGILSGAGIGSVQDVPNLAALEKLQAEIAAGNLGVQNIRSDFFVSPLGSERIQLPRAFHFLGQKFIPDSWVFSQTVYDSILWDGGKVQRRVPSALDAAFAVLANDQIVPVLVARMNNTSARTSLEHAEKWRDGLPYQHQLAALRNILDAHDPSVRESNIYMGWLAALRQLSTPTTGDIYPDVLRTRAWAMKTLNTQLASWTHLRHDTILYAKQSYTGVPICYYPAGYVEPRVGFWRALAATARRAANLIETLPYEGSYSWMTWQWDQQQGASVGTRTELSLTTIRADQVAHLRKFAATMDKLEQLSKKQLAQECFDLDDELFIRNLIQDVGLIRFGSGGVRKYDGWYPQLFYRGVQFNVMGGFESEANFHENYGVNAIDHVVADVHTDLPAPLVGDPGSVLHQGVGNVNLLLAAIENGPDRMIFAGPVLSHYEFEITGSPRRLTDSEWSYLLYGSPPADVARSRVEGLKPPTWTRDYLVPRNR